MRAALKFYEKYRTLYGAVNADKVSTYIELLANGEHVVLDIDHWLLFLKFMESHPEKEKFWELNKAISAAHAEQLKHQNFLVESVLRRLEACNFFTVTPVSTNEYRLMLSSEVLKSFIKTLLQETLIGMGFTVEIKENLAKLRLRVLNEQRDKLQ